MRVVGLGEQLGRGQGMRLDGKVRLVVRSLGRAARRGWVELGGLRFRCALGRGGIVARKREGDGATPAGAWGLCEVLWRADRGRRPATGLAARAIRSGDGWCDAPLDRNYNRPVRHPYPASAERLWREDRLYDVVVVVDYNRRPRVRGRGSAIFIHVSRPDYAPTEGCIALAERDLRRLLARARRETRMELGR
jgi:L,D-peptidoglycan transpeptidase YkuD (ErfK/YbiS/YcfS/YnhG family)